MIAVCSTSPYFSERALRSLMTYLLKRKSVIFFHREEYLIVGLNSKKIDQKKATYQKSKGALTILLKIKKNKKCPQKSASPSRKRSWIGCVILPTDNDRNADMFETSHVPHSA
jgi:hypothetical protein